MSRKIQAAFITLVLVLLPSLPTRPAQAQAGAATVFSLKPGPEYTLARSSFGTSFMSDALVATFPVTFTLTITISSTVSQKLLRDAYFGVLYLPPNSSVDAWNRPLCPRTVKDDPITCTQGHTYTAGPVSAVNKGTYTFYGVVPGTINGVLRSCAGTLTGTQRTISVSVVDHFSDTEPPQPPICPGIGHLGGAGLAFQ